MKSEFSYQNMFIIVPIHSNEGETIEQVKAYYNVTEVESSRATTEVYIEVTDCGGAHPETVEYRMRDHYSDCRIEELKMPK